MELLIFLNINMLIESIEKLNYLTLGEKTKN